MDSRHRVCCTYHFACPRYGQHWTESGLIRDHRSVRVRDRDRDGRRHGCNPFFVRNYCFHISNTMPICCAGDPCLFPNLPLEGRHCCAICKKDHHGVCGIFNGDDTALTYRNRCFLCPASTGGIDGRNIAAAAVTTPPAPQQDKPAFTQQSAIISAKDLNPKEVGWGDIKSG